MKALPVDKRGFPVPWFVAWENGEPLFPVVDASKIVAAHKYDKCWVCGGKLGRYRASVIGPMCAINRTISEPQSHVECARFSARNCPFLARPNMKRVPDSKHPEYAVDAAGIGLKRNPGACAVWIETRQTKPFRAGQGYLFELGDAHSIEWYANGREATREEVLHSIETGLPLLEATIEDEIPSRRQAARDELERRRVATLDLLPA